MSRTETRRVDISCTRDKNVLAESAGRNENGSAGGGKFMYAENSRRRTCLPNERHSRARERSSETFENAREGFIVRRRISGLRRTLLV